MSFNYYSQYTLCAFVLLVRYGLLWYTFERP
jgi:hypothetical protein